MEYNLKSKLESEIRRLDKVENKMIEDSPLGFVTPEMEATPEWKQIEHQRNYCKSLVLTIDLLQQQFDCYKDWMQKV